MHIMLFRWFLDDIILNFLAGLKNTETQNSYCTARLAYSENDIEKAYYWIGNALPLTFLPDEQSVELEKEYAAFQQKVQREFAAYQVEQEDLERQAFENRIVNGIPFVGMPESRIADTTLGTPDPVVRHNTEMNSGKVYKANLYDFRVNGHRIFCARCISGRVVQVWDERDKDTSKPYAPYRPEKETPSPRYDPYDVYDYGDSEDFYYDHEDEFEDFEDAEDYYDEAWNR